MLMVHVCGVGQGNKRIIADSEYSPSTSTPQDPNCYFSLVFPEKGEAEEEEPSPVVEERRRHTIRESGGVKKLRRIIEVGSPHAHAQAYD
jgi:hypothetical protein